MTRHPLNNTPPTRRQFLKSTAATATAASLIAPLADADEKSKQDNAIPIIDCHLHINHMGRSVKDTIAHIRATGTKRAFILPLETGEGGVLLKSQTVLDAYREYPDEIIPFCQSNVRKPDVLERIMTYHRLGCRGVGEQKEHLPLNDPRIDKLIALCDELDWPITLHFQDGKGGYNQGIAEQLEKYLKKYQKVRIIGHAQSWWAHISAEVPPPEKTLYPTGPVKPGGLIDRLLADYPNLYADLSAGSGYNALTRDKDFTAGFLERHHRKLLFGSDCPCRDGKGANFRGVCYSMRLQKFLRSMVDDPAKLANIFYHNAMRVLGEA